MRFEDKNGIRWYLHEGKLYLSVTSMLDCILKKSLQSWFKKTDGQTVEKRSKLAADAGSRFHALIEKHFKGIQVVPDEDLKETWDLFIDWLKDKPIVPLANEMEVFSSLGFGGTLDMLAAWAGLLEYIDFKTGKSIGGPKAGWQVALYKLADEETSSRSGGGIRIIQPSIQRKEVKDFKIDAIDRVTAKALHVYESWKGLYFTDYHQYNPETKEYTERPIVAPDGREYYWGHWDEDAFIKVLQGEI